MDFETISLRFAQTTRSALDGEPSRFCHEWNGDVVLWTNDLEVDIGAFSAQYVDVEGAVTEGESVFDVFDSFSETVGYYEDLYDYGTDDFKEGFVRAACGDDYLWGPNLLILNRLVIEPKFRGKSRGLIALRAIIHTLRPGAGLIAMKPFPLQNEARFLEQSAKAERARLLLDSFPANHRVATAALCRYYGRLGFNKVPRSGYMVLDPNLKLVPVEELQKLPAIRPAATPRLRMKSVKPRRRVEKR